MAYYLHTWVSSLGRWCLGVPCTILASVSPHLAVLLGPMVPGRTWHFALQYPDLAVLPRPIVLGRHSLPSCLHAWLSYLDRWCWDVHGDFYFFALWPTVLGRTRHLHCLSISTPCCLIWTDGAWMYMASSPF